MRILFTSYPAYGHLHPLVPLALAAQAAGHDVMVASGGKIVDWAVRCGLDAVPVGVGEDEAAEIADREFAGPQRTNRMFVDVWVGAAAPDLLDVAASWRPDLVVHEEEEYAGVLVAAARGIPCVTQSWSAPARPVEGQEFAVQALQPIWDRYVPGVQARRTGSLYLDACPPAFQGPAIDLVAASAEVVHVRPGTFDGPPVEPSPWLADLARPAAYVTLGTVAVFSTPELLERLGRALADVVATVVLTTGPNPVESLDELPSNVQVVRYLAQSHILPHVDLLVSHAGAGGTVGAIMAGLPHLVLPGSGDSQQTGAAAIERVGVGLRLLDGDRAPERIAAAARTLLTDPSFGQATTRLRAELLKLPEPAEVVTLLERLVG